MVCPMAKPEAGRWVFTSAPSTNGKVLCLMVLDGWRTLRAYVDGPDDINDMMIAMLNKLEVS